MENEEEKKKKRTAASVATASMTGGPLARNAGAAVTGSGGLSRTPSPMPSSVPSPAPITANMSGGMKDPSDPFNTKSMGGGLMPSILGGYFGQKAAGANTPQSDAAAGGLFGLGRQPAPAPTPSKPMTMPANTGIPSRAGAISQLSQAPAVPMARPASTTDLDVMLPRPQVGVPLRNATASAPITPQIPAAMGIQPYGRPSFMPSPTPAAPLASAVAPFQGATGNMQVNPPTQQEAMAAKNSLERSPANRAAIDLGRQAQAGVDIRVGTGSAFDNAKVAEDARRAGVVGNLQSGRDMSVAGAMSGGATEEQALAMGAQRGTPQVTQGMRDEAALLTGGKNITPRAQAQGMFAEPMDAKEAQAKMVEADKKGGPAKTAEQTKAAKAKGAERWAKAQEADKLRRTTDPLALMNIARAQERPAQLAEKRTIAEQKAAANRLMRSAMGQGDPRVKAQMVAQAGEMAKAIGERPAAKRTTYGDIVDKQQATKTAEAQAASQRQHELDMAKARYGGGGMTEKDQADIAKTKAETENLKNRMSDADKVEIESLALALKSGELVGDNVTTILKQMKGITDKYRKPSTTPAAGGTMPKSFNTMAEAEAANLKPGTEIIINGRRAVVE